MNNCQICLNEIKDNENAITCGHYVHRNCITKYFFDKKQKIKYEPPIQFSKGWVFDYNEMLYNCTECKAVYSRNVKQMERYHIDENKIIELDTFVPVRFMLIFKNVIFCGNMRFQAMNQHNTIIEKLYNWPNYDILEHHSLICEQSSAVDEFSQEYDDDYAPNLPQTITVVNHLPQGNFNTGVSIQKLYVVDKCGCEFTENKQKNHFKCLKYTYIHEKEDKELEYGQIDFHEYFEWWHKLIPGACVNDLSDGLKGIVLLFDDKESKGLIKKEYKIDFVNHTGTTSKIFQAQSLTSKEVSP